MLKRLKARGFKSLRDVSFELPSITVLFGPNAAGKSNVIDAIQALSRIGTERTLAEALSEPIRGHPIEAFTFPPGGLAELLGQDSAEFELEADIETAKRELYRYRVAVRIEPASGRLTVADEYLNQLTRRGDPRRGAAIERVNGDLHIRRKSKPAHPRKERLGANHSILSDTRLAGAEYRWIEEVRAELADWRTYYLDPRVAMRAAQPPSEVRDIGMLGGDVAAFLYRLRMLEPKRFEALKRALRTLVPGVEDLAVDLDKRRGTLDLFIRQGGVDYSSRIISEGTLRVLALCAIAVNPWGGGLIAFEEPENGVHPRRLELIARLIWSLAHDFNRQVVVTTHSPLFAGAVLELARQESGAVALYRVLREEESTLLKRFDVQEPLFQDAEIREALKSRGEDDLFVALQLRGLLDG